MNVIELSQTGEQEEDKPVTVRGCSQHVVDGDEGIFSLVGVPLFAGFAHHSEGALPTNMEDGLHDIDKAGA